MSTEYISEIHRLLRIGDNTNSPTPDPEASSSASRMSAHKSDKADAHGIPHGLPVMEEVHTNHNKPAVIETKQTHKEETTSSTYNLKSLMVYPVIFVVAFAFFYLILNFPSLTAQVQGYFSAPQDEQILGNDTTEYYKWIGNYYYAIADKSFFNPNNDIDKDGLSNMDEFIMRTNPILADSDSDGFSDGIELINSANPWGSGGLTPAQKELVKDLDMIVINNRISYNVSQNRSASPTAPTFNYDLSKNGRLSIPRLNMTVPLIWSKDVSEFENDLTHGVIHYPGTALPGEQGTIYVSGHSSDYLWKHDPFHDVFARLNFLKPGDDIFIDIYGADGKVFNYRYRVTGNATYTPDDQTQFIDNSTNKLNLSTCWPIGTQKDRLVVSAVQIAL